MKIFRAQTGRDRRMDMEIPWFWIYFGVFLAEYPCIIILLYFCRIEISIESAYVFPPYIVYLFSTSRQHYISPNWIASMGSVNQF